MSLPDDDYPFHRQWNGAAVNEQAKRGLFLNELEQALIKAQNVLSHCTIVQKVLKSPEMSLRTLLFASGVLLLAHYAESDCPTVMRQKGEPLDSQRWAQMAACANGLHGQYLINYLNEHQDVFKVSKYSLWKVPERYKITLLKT